MAEQVSARVMYVKGGAANNQALENAIIAKNAQGIPLTPEEQAYWDERQKQSSTVAQDAKSRENAINQNAPGAEDTRPERREAEDRRRRAASGGPGSTILTSPLGLPPEPQNVKRKTLLGS